MERIRLWAFPIALVFAWLMAAAYTASLMIEDIRFRSPEREPAEVAQSADEPA